LFYGRFRSNHSNISRCAASRPLATSIFTYRIFRTAANRDNDPSSSPFASFCSTTLNADFFNRAKSPGSVHNIKSFGCSGAGSHTSLLISTSSFTEYPRLLLCTTVNNPPRGGVNARNNFSRSFATRR